jgi:hypothetical protein
MAYWEVSRERGRGPTGKKSRAARERKKGRAAREREEEEDEREQGGGRGLSPRRPGQAGGGAPVTESPPRSCLTRWR